MYPAHGDAPVLDGLAQHLQRFAAELWQLVQNSTPLWARLTSPGRGTVPPPAMAAALTLWWGLRNGRCCNNPVPACTSPATE